MIFGEIVVLIYGTVFFIAKASLEAFYSHSLQAAKKTIRLWAAVSVSIILSLGLSLLFYYFG